MSICDKCVHREVCCDEGMGEEALTFCANLLEERAKGKWIAQDEFGACFKCSNCGIGIDNDFPVYRSYCPNCGANMVADLCSICKHGDNCERSDKGISFANHSVCWKFER